MNIKVIQSILMIVMSLICMWQSHTIKRLEKTLFIKEQTLNNLYNSYIKICRGQTNDEEDLK